MGETYFVGTGRVDITPSLDRPVYLAGFAPDRIATEILHPLEVHALYVRDSSGGAICLVTIDLIGFLHPSVLRVRARVTHVLDPQRVILCSTHTHSGPDTLGLWGKAFLGIPYRTGVDKGYLAGVEDAVVRSIELAVASAAPAELAAGRFEVPADLVRNDRKGGGSYPMAFVLGVVRDGQPVSALLNFGAHPEALWEKNRAVSADYPAPFRNRMADVGIEALFFQAPLGAMLTPNVPPKSDQAQRRQYIEQMGTRLAELTRNALAEAEPLAGPVKLASTPLQVANLNRRFTFAGKVGFIDRPLEDGVIHTAMAFGCIGGLRFVTVPGEVSPEVGHELYQACGKGLSMVFTLGLDELGYIIPAEFFNLKEYAYEKTMSIGPHAASTFVKTAYALREECERGPD
jgi:hypothetical protein